MEHRKLHENDRFSDKVTFDHHFVNIWIKDATLFELEYSRHASNASSSADGWMFTSRHHFTMSSSCPIAARLP